MSLDPKQLLRGLAISALTTTLAAPQGLSAQASEHVVNPAELQKAAADASRTRQQNRETLNEFFSSEKARQALKAGHTDPEQVKNAVGVLNDAELAQLASRAQKAQTDFAAGSINDRDLLIILVAIAALILIIVAVR
jgi:hypothetical protein